MEEDLTRTSEFVTNQVFNSREEITEWVRKVGRQVGCVVVTKRSKSKGRKVIKVVFACEHSGVYKTDTISSRHTGTKKFGCPFELIALNSVRHHGWTLRVVCDVHNHVLAQHMEGHAYASRLNEAEFQLVEDLTAQHVKPRYILSTLKGRNVENVSTSKTIYNEIQNIKTRNDAGRPRIENVLGDGNCGFRAISTCLGGHEDSWDYIRQELMVELTKYQQYYSYVIGSNECVRIYEALNFFTKGISAPFRHWIVMPEMGILTASRFNVILHVLSQPGGNVTYLPFRTQPPSSSEHVSIAIVHVDGNHYIKVVLAGEYPMPTLTHHWTRTRLSEASTWIIPYQRRFDMYEEYIERTRTRDFVDLKD